MKGSFQLKEIFTIEPSVFFHAWLNSQEHSLMTGGEAICGNNVGDEFTAWDGYISGKNISLILDQEINQSWRTSEFKDSDEDSELSIRIIEIPEGCEVILSHKNIPEGQADYKQGWIDHYFNPMKTYFHSK